jgi:hypothetical protein
MVTPQVRPKTTPGKAPRGNLTYVAILAFVVAVVLVIAVSVRPVLHTQTPSRDAVQGGASTTPSTAPAPSS